jgi:DNA-binding LytR/AlgR family response regulator
MENKKKILIIEDDAPVREGVVILLEKKGFDVISAKNGAEGLSLIHKRLPDLIICDIMMPGLDGISLKETIEADEELSLIPFIFLTAKADIRDIRKGMEAGADDYIVKPFDLSDLLKAIELRLKKKNSYRIKHSGKEEDRLGEGSSIFIDDKNNPHFIKVSGIITITASGNYTNLHQEGGKVVLVRKTLSEWEEQLPENLFRRIHRSTIINIHCIEKMDKWSSGTYLIKIKGIEEKFNVSQRYAAKLRKSLG